MITINQFGNVCVSVFGHTAPSWLEPCGRRVCDIPVEFDPETTVLDTDRDRFIFPAHGTLPNYEIHIQKCKTAVVAIGDERFFCTAMNGEPKIRKLE